MDKQINKFVLATQTPPVMEVKNWVKLHGKSEIPLLNLSQAAPMSPPPDSLLKFLSEQALLTENHLYGDVLGDIPKRYRGGETASDRARRKRERHKRERQVQKTREYM